MSQHHEVPKVTPRQIAIEILVLIQILCARGASLERIHEEAERAIEVLTGRH